MSNNNRESLSPARIAQALRAENWPRIKHCRIAQMMRALQTSIDADSQDSILLACGPTGVGKSTLARFMVEAAVDQAKGEIEEDPGVIPAVYVEAPASGESEFSWRLFYQRILEQLEPELGLPKAHYGVDPHTGMMVRPHGAGRNNLASTRSAVERALQSRKVQFLVIDEAAHIINQTRGNAGRLQVQLDTLKSLANTCGTQMVLVGSYDLYQLVSLSAQLARRTHVLHFERYHEQDRADEHSFASCVHKFQQLLPELWGDSLVAHARALHENTLGCVGTLRTVVMRAARLAQAEGGWSEDILRRALLTDAQRRQILEEIIEGEAAINPGMTRTMPAQVRQKKTKGRNAA